MSKIRSKLESMFARSGADDSDDENGATEEQTPEDLLYECRECSTVYLSDGARECSRCNSMTTAIGTAD